MAHIRYTTKLELNGTKIKKFPVIITENLKVHLLSLQYFLTLRSSSAESTISTYARHLVDFFNQLEFDNQDLTPCDDGYTEWDEITDSWLEQYKNALTSRYDEEANNTKCYVSQVLRTVIAYLLWAERHGYTSNLIGFSEDNLIQVQPSTAKQNTAVHPLVKKLSKEKSPTKTAPRMEWIQVIKANTAIKGQEPSVRYELMIDWGVNLGLRAHEICGLVINQLPKRETAEKAFINGRMAFIDIIISKGGKPKRVPVNPMLIKQTWDFIDNERNTIIQKIKRSAKRKKVSVIESDSIFISSTTGREITPKAFSNQLRQAWLKAVKSGELTEDERVWVHGLRYRFATDLLKGMDQKGVKQPERIAKHSTRHAHESSLDTYTISRYSEDNYG